MAAFAAGEQRWIEGLGNLRNTIRQHVIGLPRDPVRRGRRTYLIVCVAIIWLVSAACSLDGDGSSSCDANKGEETLEAARLGTEGLTVVEDCTEVYKGLREGEVRTVVVRGRRSVGRGCAPARFGEPQPGVLVTFRSPGGSPVV